jgi:membrane protease YdiL (CAAX protease family)
MPSAQRQRLEILSLAVAFEGGLAALACLLVWLADQPTLGKIHGTGWDALIGIAASIPLLLLFGLFIAWPVGPLGRIKAFSVEVIRPLFQFSTVLDLAIVSLVAGFAEELLFRGVLQDLLAQWLSLWAAILFTSTVFGLLHLITPTYALMAGCMGGYLSLVSIWSGNLLGVMIAHGVYDFLALLYLCKETRGEG